MTLLDELRATPATERTQREEALLRVHPLNVGNALRHLVRLEAAAKPGNWAWRELENVWGHVFDYSRYDAGN
jgi:hypothetical protein